MIVACDVELLYNENTASIPSQQASMDTADVHREYVEAVGQGEALFGEFEQLS